MSNSYRRQPFMSICGHKSAKKDKRLANRGVRRKQNAWLKQDVNFEESLPPHRYECHWNEVWGWVRDGNQMYQGLTSRDYFDYLEAIHLLDDHRMKGWKMRVYGSWPPPWYKEMMRK